MSDPITSPVVVPAAPVPSADVKSGWRTTELFLAVLALGALGWALQQTVSYIPTILSTPGMPAWAAPIGVLAPVGLGWLIKLVIGEYNSLRTQLKISALPDSISTSDTLNAVAAGAAAATGNVSATLAAGNG